MTTNNRISPTQFQGTARFHLALNVSDLAQSINFYQHLFDQPPSKVKEDYAKFEPTEPSINFTLNQSQSKSSGGPFSHMGIQLKDTDSLASVRARLMDLNLVEENQTSCCYALQDKFWVKDPDGNDIEFFVVLEKDAEPQPGEDQRPVVQKQPQRELCCPS